MSVSGGFGKWYELAFSLVARARRLRIFFHHHTFSYVDQPSFAARLLVRVGGRGATHLALSPVMADKLKVAYGIDNIRHLSNAAFLPFPDAAVAASLKRPFHFGFISNVSREKGVFEFIDMIEALNAAGVGAIGSLAGPFQDAAVEQEVRSRLGEVENIKYVGPKYGDHKETFYRAIDVLIFPTLYANEAEPLTILEAFSFGVPAIAYGRGAIPEIITDGCGAVVDIGAPFVPAALATIAEWFDRPDLLAESGRACRERFCQMRMQGRARLDALLDDVSARESRSAC
jgi:glycosyltransferase involved in cell wall biosynthesis